MPVYIGGLSLSGGTSLTVTDSNQNRTYQQDSSGRVVYPQTAGSSVLTPLFNVGLGSTNGWVTCSGVVVFNYTGGNGYLNVGSCYNTGTGAFTAPWTGLYLFKSHMYCYGNSGSYTWYYQPMFSVNGSTTARRPGGELYRIRQYGLYSNYGQDTDICELIYLTAGDYVQTYVYNVGTMQSYDSYSAWSGAYLGS